MTAFKDLRPDLLTQVQQDRTLRRLDTVIVRLAKSLRLPGDDEGGTRERREEYRRSRGMTWPSAGRRFPIISSTHGARLKARETHHPRLPGERPSRITELRHPHCRCAQPMKDQALAPPYSRPRPQPQPHPRPQPYPGYVPERALPMVKRPRRYERALHQTNRTPVRPSSLTTAAETPIFF